MANRHTGSTIGTLRSAVERLPFDQLLAHLQAASRPVRNITIPEFISPIPAASVGLYFFFDRSNLVYIGSSRSRSLVERVPAHFDPRQSAWFNVLPKRLVERGHVQDLETAVARALTFRVALIFDDTGRGDLLHIEKVLRHNFRPMLNPPRGAHKYSGNIERCTECA